MPFRTPSRISGAVRGFIPIFILFCGIGACAEPAETARVDPAQIRFITPTAASSPCLGDPATPLCAVETLIGCAGRVWNQGCAKINFDFNPAGLPPLRVEYVLVKAGFVNKEKVRAARKNDPPSEILEPGEYSWLSENAFQVLFFDRECPATKTDCWASRWLYGMATVKPHEGRWVFSEIGIFDPNRWFVD